jgi:hypothetical protein
LKYPTTLRDVSLQQRVKLAGREVTVGQPIRIVGVPAQIVAAKFHACGLREADQSIARREVEDALGRLDRRPLHFVLGLDHAVLLRQGGGVGCIAGDVCRIDGRSHQHAALGARIAQSLRHRARKREQ